MWYIHLSTRRGWFSSQYSPDQTCGSTGGFSALPGFDWSDLSSFSPPWVWEPTQRGDEHESDLGRAGSSSRLTLPHRVQVACWDELAWECFCDITCFREPTDTASSTTAIQFISWLHLMMPWRVVTFLKSLLIRFLPFSCSCSLPRLDLAAF